ncbi:MAG: RNA polymerase sigma factor [Nannocystaceae bacterium]
MDENELYKAWRAGDSSAGEALIGALYPTVFRFFYTRVPTEVCEDLTQKTFERLCQRDGFRGTGSIRGYVLGIARFTLIHWVRKRRRFEPAEESLLGDAVERTINSLIADRELGRIVAAALRSLRLDDQILIELKDWEGLTQAELAELFEVPRPTVARRLQRARARLKSAVHGLVAEPLARQRCLQGIETCMRSIRRRKVERFRTNSPPSEV